ncbi:MAG: UDP-N-acetylmuramoyl-L-alanyl-D-glutamate--2,6-diaminopimelate ligase, partial [Phycisphaerae bacterium]|nr:UDP-N-acetylmuramoyl-L-alanyl-D-glutamate--2,6-diaminopimelate ligase [Phycisphaerae bacterium]
MTLNELIGPEAKLPASLAATPIKELAADSRQVAPGYLFAALPGVNADGTRFVADAVSRGAAAILVPEGVHPETSAPVIADADPRRRLALIAARFFGAQPETAVTVTGTNGKTSVTSFVRQLWAARGFEAASLGTIGVVTPRGTKVLRHTTPEPIELQGLLAELAKGGVTHLALEASSHGLQQRRIDGVTLAAGAFTNISRDHLDYHATFEDYFTQKLRLFTTLLAPGAAAVIDMDGDGSVRVADVANAHGLDVMTVGRAGETLRLVSDDIDGFAQVLGIEHGGKRHDVRLPLVGSFQAANALVAAGLVMATGANAADVLSHLENLQGARGRLDLAGTAPAGAPIFVDYAHTPDALA